MFNYHHYFTDIVTPSLSQQQLVHHYHNCHIHRHPTTLRSQSPSLPSRHIILRPNNASFMGCPNTHSTEDMSPPFNSYLMLYCLVIGMTIIISGFSLFIHERDLKFFTRTRSGVGYPSGIRHCKTQKNIFPKPNQMHQKV
jgi:hypothetical protein